MPLHSPALWAWGGDTDTEQAGRGPGQLGSGEVMGAAAGARPSDRLPCPPVLPPPVPRAGAGGWGGDRGTLTGVFVCVAPPGEGAQQIIDLSSRWQGRKTTNKSSSRLA